jgi:hypothetical protein
VSLRGDMVGSSNSNANDPGVDVAGEEVVILGGLAFRSLPSVGEPLADRSLDWLAGESDSAGEARSGGRRSGLDLRGAAFPPDGEATAPGEVKGMSGDESARLGLGDLPGDSSSLRFFLFPKLFFSQFVAFPTRFSSALSMPSPSPRSRSALLPG